MLVLKPFEPVYFGGLSVELVMFIMQYCGLETFPALSQVSRTFYSLTHDSWLINKVAPFAYNGLHLYHRALWNHLEAYMQRRTYIRIPKLSSDVVEKRKKANKHWKRMTQVKTASARNKHLEAALAIERGIIRKEVAHQTAKEWNETLTELPRAMEHFPAKWNYDREHCDLPTLEQWHYFGDSSNRRNIVYAIMTVDYDYFQEKFEGLFSSMRPDILPLIAQADSVDFAKRAKLVTNYWAGRNEHKQLFVLAQKHRSPNLLKWFLTFHDMYATVTLEVLGFEVLIALDWSEYNGSVVRSFLKDVLKRKTVSELEMLIKQPEFAEQLQDSGEKTTRLALDFPNCMAKAQAVAWSAWHLNEEHRSQVTEMLEALELSWNDLWVMVGREEAGFISAQHKIFELANGDIANENAQRHVSNRFTKKYVRTEEVIKAIEWAKKIDGCDPVALLAQPSTLQRCSLTSIVKKVHPRHYERLMDEALKHKNAKCISTLVIDLCYVPTKEQAKKAKKAGKKITGTLKKAKTRLLVP